MRNLTEHIIKQVGFEIEEDWKRNLATGALAVGLLAGTPSNVQAKEPIQKEEHQIISIPSNLWRGLVAEETKGNLESYKAIASVVRNRLAKKMSTGLVALKRSDLVSFTDENRAYILKVKKLDTKKLAEEAINLVFNQNNDYVNGADHYEHTGKYKVPDWASKMKKVKVLYPGTKKEITFWKS